MAYLKL
jgi:hypothetical protein